MFGVVVAALQMVDATAATDIKGIKQWVTFVSINILRSTKPSRYMLLHVAELLLSVAFKTANKRQMEKICDIKFV